MHKNNAQKSNWNKDMITNSFYEYITRIFVSNKQTPLKKVRFTY